MAEDSSLSSDSNGLEGFVRSTVVSVQAFSRFRSISGNFFAPSGCGRVRRDSAQTTTNGSMAGTPTSAITPAVASPSNGPGRDKYLRTVLILTNTYLYYESQGWRREMLLEDLIGVQVDPKPPSNNPTACQVDIHYYPQVVNRSGKKQGRKRLVMTVQFNVETDLKENVQAATDWKKAIILECHRVLSREFYFGDDSSMELREFEAVQASREFLVFINPVGGSGRAVADFKQHVQPLFDLAELKYNVIQTERQNHARDITRGYDLTTIDGIIISSGDGLLYEVVNGLMEREDWETAVKIPIGMLPTGSGNGLCGTTLYESHEEFSLTNAAFQIIRGGIIPMDVATVQTGDGYKCYMTIFSNWGLLADADIESEKFRMIGGMRFIIGTISCVIKKRAYYGKISYLPVDDEDNTQTAPTEQDSSPSQQETDNSSSLINQSVEEQNIHDAESDLTTQEDKPRNGTIHTSSDIGIHEPSALQYSSPVSDGPAHRENLDQPLPIAEASPCTSIATPTESQKMIMTKCPYGPSTDLLPPLSDPVPSNWKTVEKKFLSVTCLMISHFSGNFIADRDMSIGTEKIRLLFVEHTVTRKRLLSVLNDAEIDHQLDSVSSIDCKAYRLEPSTPVGLMTVDGECVPYGVIQSQIHPGLTRVMCRKRRT